MGSFSCGNATTTLPQPVYNAAVPASNAEPIMPSAPPKTPMLPNVPLWLSAGLGFSRLGKCCLA